VFRASGNFPSTVSLYEDPVIKDFVNPFFNNAPVGQIFSTSVKQMVPQYMGPKSGDINTAIINGLTRIEEGKQSPDQAWTQVLTDVMALN
jgi:cellobiose transport system substrate-binding protein